MEFVVYVLYSDKHNKTYVGYTSDLISRFNSHNKFATKGYTIKFRPWKVIHIEFYQDKKSAMSREKYFKNGTGRDFLKTLLP